MITCDQIVRQIYKQSNKKVPMKDIDVIVRALFETITEHLNKDEQVYIANFGTFALTSDIKKQLVRKEKKTKPK